MDESLGQAVFKGSEGSDTSGYLTGLYITRISATDRRSRSISSGRIRVRIDPQKLTIAIAPRAAAPHNSHKPPSPGDQPKFTRHSNKYHS